MIKPAEFLEVLSAHNISFFTGVPDSLLKDICAFIDDHKAASEHIISANEGTAMATALGHHLATGKTPLVYMQNSGLGNIINPLTSLCDKEVYSIPMVLMIGWRGEPGVKDEPQHVKKGRVTEALLKTLEVPTFIIDSETNYKAEIEVACRIAEKDSKPVALLIRKGSFEAYKSSQSKSPLSELNREQAINTVLDSLSNDDVIVSTTGKTSRELYELRVSRNEKTNDFLTVGGMGHTSSIALGAALGNPNKRVICLDGDGSLLMHMGAITNIGKLAPKNFLHIVLNNGAHESVGGQKTVARDIDLKNIFLSSGYKSYYTASSTEEIEQSIKAMSDGPSVLEIKIKTGARSDLGRPKSSPVENKIAFMDALNGN